MLWFALDGYCALAAHTRAVLQLSADAARPGDTIFAGIRLRMEPGWHTYWQNPGASGMPTTIDWQLPPGITPGTVQWPIPDKLPDKDLTTYIYKDETVVVVPLEVSASQPAGMIELKAHLSWLECAIQCIPGNSDIHAELKIDPTAGPVSDNSRLAAWQKHLPKLDPTAAPRAWWEREATENLRPVLIEWNSQQAAGADFFPDASEAFEVQPEVDQLASEAGRVRIRKQIKKLSGEWPTTFSGILVQGSGDERVGYLAKMQLSPSALNAARPGTAPLKSGETALPATPPFWQMLLYGFIGGLILNVMPCVLPVIALKILGFVGPAKDNPGRARWLALIYAAGVLVSFLALAALVLGVKAAGHKAGWGLQFSSPYFLVAMTTLVTLIALNLFGVFEVHLGGRAMDTAANLSSGHGTAGAFFNGLLATVLATSCTAPFLGAAVGFAFAPSQTALTTVAIFLAVGVGLALPYVLLTWQPGWLRFLPKPGLWMERFKVGMGFPMLAAAVWLFSLVNVYYAERSWWLAIFLVMVAVAAWVYGEFVQRQRGRPALGTVITVGLLAAAYCFVLEGHLRWREPVAPERGSDSSGREAGGLAWEAWSPAAVERARTEHKPVLVDFTAKWCLTCNTVVKPALESSSVRKRVQELHAVTLLGDYTRFPDDITEELTRHGRAGVPLVLVYPADASKPPIVLPEAITPGMVVNALDRAQM